MQRILRKMRTRLLLQKVLGETSQVRVRNVTNIQLRPVFVQIETEE